jgi:hypothetical protein
VWKEGSVVSGAWNRMIPLFVHRGKSWRGAADAGIGIQGGVDRERIWVDVRR